MDISVLVVTSIILWRVIAALMKTAITLDIDINDSKYTVNKTNDF